MLLAHGIGTRTDLPVPIGLAALAAAAALIISFAVLGLFWRRPRPERPGRPLPRPLAAMLESPAVRTALQTLTALLAAAVCAVGLFGPATVSANLAPWMFYIVFWVGIVPASVLLGPVWRVLNPLRVVHAALARVLRIDPEAGVHRLPDSWGYRPAAVSLAVFGWFELVYPERGTPGAVAVFLLGYAVVHVAAATVFGRGWFERADGFEVYSALLGTLAPVGRLPDGRLGWRNPLDGLQRFPIAPGLSAVVIVLVGTTAYDGLSRSTWWTSDVPGDAVTSTLGLFGAMLAVCVIYQLGTWAVVGSVDTHGHRPSSAAFASTLAPIAAGYSVAHYFSLFVFDGQQAIILASDPFDTGLDLFGTATRTIDYTVVGTATIAAVQLGAIVAGHLIATLAAHDRAVRMYPGRVGLRTQYPMLAAMVTLTVGAVGLVYAV